ncbi:MAG TPA: DUF2092 domain-containing protein [Acidocella sp.]|jgi:hypothetical protein|nr:DUF2092 domain-containing protein [Acidocella sp.]
MSTKVGGLSRRLLAQKAGALFVICLCAANTAAAQQGPTAITVQNTSTSAQAKMLLLTAADYLAKAKGFSVNVDANYDITQPSGQKIEFGERYHVLLSRPDDLRIDFEDRDGSKRQILFDGSTMTMFEPGQAFYGSLTKPGTVDQIIAYIVNELQTPIPMSLLLLTSAPRQLQKRVTEVALVDNERLGGTLVYHLAARTADVDFQVWIAQGNQPTPRRIVITYKKSPGQPQFSALLSGWRLNPPVNALDFAFTPPAGARPVGFMVPVNGPAAVSGEGAHK